VKAGIRIKLVGISMALLVPSLLAAHAWLTHTLTDFLSAETRMHLSVRTALLASDVAQDAQDPAVDWQAAAHAYGARASARVTLLSRDGVVLGDSERTTAERDTMDNHAHRTEVEVALRGNVGTAVRTSPTLNIPMLYLATPLLGAARGPAVVRLAVPLRDVDEALQRMRGLLLVAGLLSILVALAMSTIVAQWAARTARELTATARRMADGDLTARANARSEDEFGELAAALNRLAQGLSTSMVDLTAERDVLATILGGMQEGVVLLDPQRRVEMLNPAIRDMLLLPADVVGKPAHTVFHHPSLAQLWDRVNQSNAPVTLELNLEGLKPRVMLVRASALHSHGDSILAVFFDVTDLRRLESVRRDFVANASHELRTPVASIRAAAEMLGGAMEKDPVAAARFVAMIERNSQRLQALVQDLLDLSRLEARQFALKPEPTDVAAQATQVMGLFKQRADQKRMRLSVHMDAIPQAYADKRALEQVLVNLVDNATQYCPDGTEVRVRGRVHQDLLRVDVEDNGPGIEAKHLPRLFERFYRVDKGRSRDSGGTGLGLSIVKHLVEAMGGTVDVRSTVGKGTVFSFTLPIKAPARPPSGVESPADPVGLA
jgi:two-component system phosphate regulon sensor histidine kinase PhoR